jgi:uncharacterized membrane protein
LCPECGGGVRWSGLTFIGWGLIIMVVGGFMMYADMTWLPMLACLLFCAVGIMRVFQQRRITKARQSKSRPD